MSTITEHTPDLEIERAAGAGNTVHQPRLHWRFETAADVSHEDIRTALSLIGADFDPDRDQLALSDYGTEFYGGMDAALAENAVADLKEALEEMDGAGCSAAILAGWRGFDELSPAERQEFMDYAVGCYSYVTDGNFSDVDGDGLRDMGRIVAGMAAADEGDGGD